MLSKLNLCRPHPPAPPPWKAQGGVSATPKSHRGGGNGGDGDNAAVLQQLRELSRLEQKLGARLSPSGHASLGRTLAAAQEMRTCQRGARQGSVRKERRQRREVPGARHTQMSPPRRGPAASPRLGAPGLPSSREGSECGGSLCLGGRIKQLSVPASISHARYSSVHWEQSAGQSSQAPPQPYSEQLFLKGPKPF